MQPSTTIAVGTILCCNAQMAVKRRSSALWSEPSNDVLPRFDTVRFAYSPDQFLMQRYNRRGSPFRLDLLRPLGSTLVFGHPEQARDVLAPNPGLLGAPKNDFLSYALGGSSLLRLDGQSHHQQRRRLLPVFAPDSISQGSIDAVVDESCRTVKDPSNIPVVRFSQRIVSGLFEELLFGSSTSSTTIACAMRGFAESSFSLSALLPFTLMTDDERAKSLTARMTSAGKAAQVLLEEIRAEMSRRETSPPTERTADFLERARAASSSESTRGAEVSDAILSFLVAGWDTTIAAMSWTILALAREDSTRRHAISADANAVRAALDEALRLWPPLILVGRFAAEPVYVGGYRVGVGENIAASPLLIQRDPRNYPTPLTFDPDRFIDATPDPQLWIPFGGGERRCIGQLVMRRLVEGVVASIIPRLRSQQPPMRVKVRRLGVAMVPNGRAAISLNR